MRSFRPTLLGAAEWIDRLLMCLLVQYLDKFPSDSTIALILELSELYKLVIVSIVIELHCSLMSAVKFAFPRVCPWRKQ